MNYVGDVLHWFALPSHMSCFRDQLEDSTLLLRHSFGSLFQFQ